MLNFLKAISLKADESPKSFSKYDPREWTFEMSKIKSIYNV